jgi:hypothetical protein
MAEPVDRVDATRVLLWLYGLFVVAAGSRSLVQLVLHASRAPVAYALSAVAAALYAAGFVLVRRAARGGPVLAAAMCAAVELIGVLVVGTLSVTVPRAFPDATVWSRYGAGYLCVPLVLPVCVLLRMRRLARSVVDRRGAGVASHGEAVAQRQHGPTGLDAGPARRPPNVQR